MSKHLARRLPGLGWALCLLLAGSAVHAQTTPAGRLLASNCFQCHGTEGTGGFDNIRGESASELKEFLTKSASSNIMAAHAQGYTVAQLDAIAAYLNQ